MNTEKIKNCIDCPIRTIHRGRGEFWNYCASKFAPKGNIIGYKTIQHSELGFPEWCPLPITIEGINGRT